jgi:hypothetical protein
VYLALLEVIDRGLTVTITDLGLLIDNDIFLLNDIKFNKKN